MANEADDYDIFLENWQGSELLQYATLPQNIGDPYIENRLLEDSSAESNVERTEFSQGQKKIMHIDEQATRGLKYFKDCQACWAREFRDYVLCKNVSIEKLDAYVSGFSNFWIDGMSRRQHSNLMLSIKASIRDYDRHHHPQQLESFVLETVPNNVKPHFTVEEMAIIFEANSGLIDAFLPNYVDYLEENSLGSIGCISDLTVRRGVYMPSVENTRRERYYLSSYSLALGPIEQFAQLWTTKTKNTGIPSLFSAPLPAIQDRIVAFAPFIAGMDLSQLEFIVAPPVTRTPLKNDGEFGGINEFSFE